MSLREALHLELRDALGTGVLAAAVFVAGAWWADLVLSPGPVAVLTVGAFVLGTLSQLTVTLTLYTVVTQLRTGSLPLVGAIAAESD